MDFEEQVLEGLEGSLEANANSQEPEGNVEDQPGSEENSREEQTQQEFEVDGVKLSADENKELLELRNSYTQKTQELAERRKELERLEPILEAVKSPEKYDKVMKALQDKEEQIQQKEDDIESALAELDPNDPYAKSLQQALSEIKGLKQELQQYTTQQQQNAEYLRQKQIQEQQEAYQKFIGEIKEYASEGLNFEDETEKELYDIAFTAALTNVDTTGMTAQDYKEVARNIGRLVYKDLLQKYKDKVIEKYRESKKVGGEERIPKESQNVPENLDGLDLQQKIEKLLGG